jgi:ABC-type uncharacterized transport system substrate-binding protein
VATDGASIGPAKQATSRSPIVMIVVGDRAGYVESLARPRGNVTGLSIFGGIVSGKRLELLKKIVPELERISAMVPPDNDEPPFLRQAAHNLGLHLQELPVTSRDQFELIHSAILAGAQALVVLRSAVTNNGATEIVTRVSQSRLPAMHPVREYVLPGGLMGYGASIGALERRAATYVDKVLNRSNPTDLPVELPTIFDFSVNVRALEALGLSIPQSVSQFVTEWVA